MSQDDATNRLRFVEYTPFFDVSLWYEVERRKLHVWRLETPAVVLRGTVPSPAKLAVTNAAHTSGTCTLNAESFDNTPPEPTGKDVIPVTLVNHNTEAELLSIDRKAALFQPLHAFAKTVLDGEFPAAGAVYGVLRTFADLKTHVFTYAVGFPVLDLPSRSSFVVVNCHAGMTQAEHAAFLEHAGSLGPAAVPFIVTAVPSHGATSYKPFTKTNIAECNEDITLAMSDHAGRAEHPGWAFRNVIAALRVWRPKTTQFTLVCVRSTPSDSVRITCTCDPADAANPEAALKAAVDATGDVRVLGWCDTKLKKIDLGAMMDPIRLAESSARLNLGLMKWRMMPELELDRIGSVKALLLGSGTLGCNIARHLLMWGVNNITLVDRGSVSYSNPVRQSLFELDDVLGEGDNRLKSIAAANRIKRILPSCNATGVQLTIRMPGHAVDEGFRQEAVRDIHTLEELIRAHDVTFLLTDSRESRWLPTLLAAAHNKPIINAALGFDSFVVMRHGMGAQPQAERAGCYFCNDVVAPIDSLTARTLDQQCTVTRPGVSAMASAIAVELLAQLCNHPDGYNCPVYIPSEDEASKAKTVLGVVPHQIRGSVRDYSTMLLHGKAYAKCTACSDVIVGMYREKGASFVIECLSNPKLMEEVSGLADDRRAVAEKYSNWDDDEVSSNEGTD